MPLAAAAGRSLDRGGYEAASAAFERAAEFSSTAETRAQRLMAAATNAWLAGQSARARHLTAQARLLADDPVLRSDIDRLRGRIEFNEGSLTTGIRILTHAAREVMAHDAQRSLELFMIASALATFVTGPDTQVDLGDVPASADTDPPRKRLYANLLAGFIHVARNDMASAAPHLREAVALGRDLTETDVMTNIGIAAFYLGDDEAFQRGFTRLLSQSREAGAIGQVLFALPRLGLADVVSGEWTLYVAHATEALQLARSTGQTGLTAMPLAELTMHAALRGDDSLRLLAGRGRARHSRRAGRRPRWAHPRRGAVGQGNPGRVRRAVQLSPAPSRADLPPGARPPRRTRPDRVGDPRRARRSCEALGR